MDNERWLLTNGWDARTSQTESDWKERASTLQDWACGAIQVAWSDDIAHQVIERSVLPHRHVNAVEIAYHVNAKNFLSQVSATHRTPF